jgi:hypothetical protein
MGGRAACSRVVIRGAGLTAAIGLLTATAAAAQTARVALEAVAAVDGVFGSTVSRKPGVWVDVFAAVRIREGLDLVARPVIFRNTFNGSRQTQLYQLGVRYERPIDNARRGFGALGLRAELGQMPSPIGFGLLENRQDLNPVISQHSAYYLQLPRNIDPEIPRTFLIAGAYPLGAQVTVAARAWDARVSLIDSSPVRGRGMLGNGKPPRMANWVVGLGVTPRTGVRIGAAVAHGPYVKMSELVDTRQGDRTAAMLQLEGEWSFDATRIAGEVVRATLETARATDARTQGGWIEVTQTLHPRVFVAARADLQQVAYSLISGAAALQRYRRYEAVGGFRLTPDLTLRAGYLTRKGYVVFHWDDQVLASLVWAKKIL